MTDGDWRIKAMDALRAEDLNRVVTLIEKMPERTRRVVTLAKVYGCGVTEIAFRLHISEQQVEDEITNAVRLMSDPDDDTETH